MEGGLFEAHTAFSVTYLLLVFIELSCIIPCIYTFLYFFMIYYEIKQNKHDTDFFLGGGRVGVVVVIFQNKYIYIL